MSSIDTENETKSKNVVASLSPKESSILPEISMHSPRPMRNVDQKGS